MSSVVQMNDNDSLHVLPLSMIPLQVKALQKTSLIKNSRLEGVIELYREGNIGSGQVATDGLEKTFDFSGDRAKDLAVVRELSVLPSYDVYSLRVSLRRLKIQIDSIDTLKLSDEMAIVLMDHMSVFTRPLIAKIYGDDDVGGGSFSDVLKLFTDPNADQARQKLRDLANSLEIELIQIPKFLEDYADIFLSLSFYKKCHDDTAEDLGEFLDDLESLAHSPQMNGHAAAAQTLDKIGCHIRDLYAEVANVLELFQVRTEDMWEEISAERYRKMSAMIVEHQENIGAILCAIIVKLDAWKQRKSTSAGISVSEKTGFITRDIGFGLERLAGLEFRDI